MNKIKKLESHVRYWFKIKYNVNYDDLDISDVPGYWRDKEAKIHPGHPLHSCIGCSGAFKATYTYFDQGRASNGRFSSPTETWRSIYNSSKRKDKP